MSAPFRYPATGAVWTGEGSLERLGEALGQAGIARGVAFVTPSLAGDPALVDRLEAAAEGRLVAVRDAIRPHTPYESVLAGATAVAAGGADGVVSVGGGSTIDTARLAALCAGAGATSAEALHALRARSGPAGPELPSASVDALPHVAVPTTLSAAEFSEGGAATCPWTGRKELFAGPRLACAGVLLDPALACRTPADVWVTTGARALDHAVETILSPRANAITDELCAGAIRTLREALPAVLADPADAAARARGQLAAWRSYAGMAGGGLGLSHAIGHQLGGRLGIAHGAASAIALPDVVALVGPRSGPQLGVLAAALAVDGSVGAVAAALDGFIRQLGLPRRLAELGIGELDVEPVADAVLDDVLVGGTPGGPPARSELVALLQGLVR